MFSCLLPTLASFYNYRYDETACFRARTVPWCLSAFIFRGYRVSATEILIESVRLPRCNRSERSAGLKSVGEIKWITEAFWETSGSLADMSSFFFFLDRGWITFHASSHFTLLHLSHQCSRRVCVCVCVGDECSISIHDLVVLGPLPWMFRCKKDEIMDTLHDFHRGDYPDLLLRQEQLFKKHQLRLEESFLNKKKNAI